MTTRLVVMADTHVRDGAARRLPDVLWRAIDGADGVLHAGDVVGNQLLDELEQRVPTWAVLGNNDHGLETRVPEVLELELDGVRVALVHASGARVGRERRVARRFPDADLVVFGHSHDPVDAPGVGEQRLFNPGSPTQRRRQPRPSYGELVLDGGSVVEHRIVLLED
jgi:putative phosphoesterase